MKYDNSRHHIKYIKKYYQLIYESKFQIIKKLRSERGKTQICFKQSKKVISKPNKYWKKADRKKFIDKNQFFVKKKKQQLFENRNQIKREREREFAQKRDKTVMNFVFNNENYFQTLNNNHIQQILNISNIYGTVSQPNYQSSVYQVESLLKQQLIQLEQNQFGQYQQNFNNTLSNSSTCSLISHINNESPPELPLFPMFPRTYNAQYDQLKQLQDPKCKYNLGSKKDKEEGGNLSQNLNTNNPQTFGGIINEQKQINQLISSGSQSSSLQIPNTKLIGFQRVAKKLPIPKEIHTENSSILQQEVNLNQINSLTKTDEEIFLSQKHDHINDTSSGTKSPVMSMLVMLKQGDQDTNSLGEIIQESIDFSCLKNSMKEYPYENQSSQNQQKHNSQPQKPKSSWISLLKEWDFQNLKKIQDSSVFEEMAQYLFKNNSSNTHQQDQEQITSSFNQVFKNQNNLLNQISKEQTHTQLNQINLSNLNETSSLKTENQYCFNTSLNSMQMCQNIKSFVLENQKEQSARKDMCNQMAKNPINEEIVQNELNEKRKEEFQQIHQGIIQYLNSINLKINYKQNDNFQLFFNQIFHNNSELNEQNDITREHRSQTSPSLREVFDKELLDASTISQQLITSPLNLLEQEDPIIEEEIILDLTNQGSSSDNTDDDGQMNNEVTIACDHVKVKKRRGLNASASLETKQNEQQSSNPVSQTLTSSNNSKSICLNKAGNLENIANQNSVQDTFMNARRNKKREQKIQQTIEQNSQLSTKFHNLTRLLMYKIIQIFKDEKNLKQCFNINLDLLSHFKKIIQKIKQHSRDTCKSSIKTNFYTHSHYNALFLILNEDNIKTLATNQKDVDAHKFIFSLDLANASAIHLSFANVLKSVAYEIVKKNLEASIMKEQSQIPVTVSASSTDKESMQNHINNLRSLYFQRAFQGITKMNNGQIVSRF